MHAIQMEKVILYEKTKPKSTIATGVERRADAHRNKMQIFNLNEILPEYIN